MIVRVWVNADFTLKSPGGHTERPHGGVLADCPAKIRANSQAQPPCVKMRPNDAKISQLKPQTWGKTDKSSFLCSLNFWPTVSRSPVKWPFYVLWFFFF